MYLIRLHSKSAFPEMISEISRSLSFLLIQDPYILSISKDIVSLGDEQIPGYEFLVRNHLSSIILWIYRKYNVTENVHETSEVPVSVRECYRAFRTELDSSPTEYLHQYRLKKAADMIVGTELKIEEIARKCGYNQTGYFSTRFKKSYLCSPTEYRKANRNSNS